MNYVQPPPILFSNSDDDDEAPGLNARRVSICEPLHPSRLGINYLTAQQNQTNDRKAGRPCPHQAGISGAQVPTRAPAGPRRGRGRWGGAPEESGRPQVRERGRGVQAACWPRELLPSIPTQSQAQPAAWHASPRPPSAARARILSQA